MADNVIVLLVDRSPPPSKPVPADRIVFLSALVACVESIVAISTSLSVIAVAISFKVSNAPGAESTKLDIAVVISAVVATATPDNVAVTNSGVSKEPTPKSTVWVDPSEVAIFNSPEVPV